RHLDHLPNPGLRGQLVEHWVVFLCDALNPMPGIHNPLRTIFMPIALEGARADFKACTGATALFHLICATSAFHLLQTRSKIASQQELEKAALEHYNLGITHISQNIQSDDGTQSVAVLASLITCILNEAVMIPTPFWRLHMKGAVEWVKQVDPQVWHQTEAASTVYQMFVGIATLIQSQLLLSDEHANIWEFQPDSAFGHRPYILGHVLGLPQSLLQGIAAINTFYRQTKDPSCHHLVQDQWTETADRIELEVYLSAPTRASLPGTDEDSELMYHHAYTYYFATLIYMKRVVKDVPLEEIQDLVDHSLSHLESLSTRSRPVFSPLLWPIAIIAFDTDREASQQRILNCVTKLAERSRLTVWASLAKWAQDMWVLRKSEGNQNLKWHHSFFLSDNDNLMMI
ncbi:fungal-specific transcription factor domain-containing protein, partial [Mariannaea sp. PMI_226]